MRDVRETVRLEENLQPAECAVSGSEQGCPVVREGAKPHLLQVCLLPSASPDRRAELLSPRRAVQISPSR